MRDLSPRGGLRRIVPCLVVVLASSACGYSLAGRGSFLPGHIQTIGIPLFENQSTVFEVEQLLTQKVRAEFIGRGKYRVVPEPTGVDAVLTGVIANISIAPIGFTAEQQASRYSITVTARLEFRDLRENKVLWENAAIVVTEEYEVTTASSAQDPTAFFGQESNALERLTTNFAKAVVSGILEAF
ncbi:MAG: LptE family protein [Acidobacteria bacterium]|nr:LptE family protein [Acidobacteriota bacterium]